MVEWSIEAFRAAPAIRSIVVACPPGFVHELGGHDLGVVEGAATRSESVARALEAVGTSDVVIHDAARPLVTPELVEGVLATLHGDPAAAGAIAAAPVADTIKRASPTAPRSQLFPDSGNKCDLTVEGTVDRGELWAAQTPQAFDAAALREAIAAASPEQVAAATDEAMLIEGAGGRVLIHPAPPENLKVTTPHDLRVAELLLAERSAG